MLRTLFIGVFLSLYILLVGPPLLVYTLITRNPNPIYWAGVKASCFLPGPLACGFTSGASSVSLRTFAFLLRIIRAQPMRPQLLAPFLEGSPFF